eukprot:SAG31_NODE_8891_length_1367_cov_1.627760_1_plen_161_part_00
MPAYACSLPPMAFLPGWVYDKGGNRSGAAISMLLAAIGLGGGFLLMWATAMKLLPVPRTPWWSTGKDCYFLDFYGTFPAEFPMYAPRNPGLIEKVSPCSVAVHWKRDGQFRGVLLDSRGPRAPQLLASSATRSRSQRVHDQVMCVIVKNFPHRRGTIVGP